MTTAVFIYLGVALVVVLALLRMEWQARRTYSEPVEWYLTIPLALVLGLLWAPILFFAIVFDVIEALR